MEAIDFAPLLGFQELIYLNAQQQPAA